jgi:Uma2 family endonuclease
MTMTPAELKEFGITLPPTQDELPYDDGEPMESQRHKMQMDILIEALYPWLNAREDGYVGGNMFVYYGLSQVRNRDFRGPDFFAVLGVPKGERKSWVCWEEEKTPDVIIELLSESTAEVDKGEKKLIYQNQMHVPEYFWYDPFNPQDLAGFQLQGGTYQPIPLNEQGHLVSQVMELALVRWQGAYLGVESTWLRWTTLDGTLLPTGAEIAEQERQRAEQEHQRAEQEHQRAEQEHQRAEQERQRAEQEQQRAEQAETQVGQIVQNLLRSGISAEQVAQMTGLTIEQVEGLRTEG